MKSSIKVAYASRYASGIPTDNEPVIRIELDNDQDDPRDTLLHCICSPTNKVELIRHPPSNGASTKDTYIIAVKNRHSQICDMLGIAFQTLLKSMPNLDSENYVLATSSDEIYFELVNAPEKAKKTRSKGLNRNELSMAFNSDTEIIGMSVSDFLDFVKTK